MIIPTADEFLEAIRGEEQRIPRVEYAKVEGFTESGKPRLKFDNETMASQKIYPQYAHVTGLRPGDRVRLTDGIIDGTWGSA